MLRIAAPLRAHLDLQLEEHGLPTIASTSGRARVPISRTIAPFFPTRIPFCDSVST